MRKSILTLGSALALALWSAGAALAQFGVINGAVVTQEYHDDPTSIFTSTVNYPTSIILSDQKVNQTGPGTYANRDVWRLSDDLGMTPFLFADQEFNVSFTLVLQGNITPRKEAGFLVDTQYGQAQFIVNSDGHEVVIFGGPFPFFSFNNTYGLTYNTGDTITLGFTYFRDTDGIKKIVYHANSYDSPTLKFDPAQTGIFAGGMVGGYLQVPIDVNNPLNGASVTFTNISISAIGGNVVAGTLAFEGIAPKDPNQLANTTFIFRSTTGKPTFTRTLGVPVGTGAFSLPGIPADKYMVRIKSDKYLADLVAVDASGGPVSSVASTQLAGDSDNNNNVDVLDFGNLVNAYGSDSGVAASGYDATVDFNYDGKVDVLDFGLLVNNYGSGGAM